VRILKAGFSLLIVFVCGGVTFVNLGDLIGSNANYDTSWFKVLIACLIAIFYGYLAVERK